MLKYPSTRELQPPSRPLIYNPRSSAVEEQVRSFSTVDNAYLQNGSQTLASHRDTILPSIEGPQPAVGSSQFQTVSANHSSLQPTLERRTITYKNDNHRHVDDIEFLDLTEDDPPLKKRRRTDNIGYEMSPDYRNEVVTHKQPFQQRKLEYIPSVTRASERTVAPASTKQLSGLDHSHSHEFLSPSTPSSRIDDGFIPSRRLQSALPADQVVVDRGIQEYRAFRARERQERVPHSPKQGKMAQPHRNGGLTHRASESESGLLRQFDGADSSRNLSHHLLSPRVVSDFLSMNESLSLPREHEYPQTSEKVLQRIPPPPRRSASPDQYPRGRVSYVPVSSELQYRQHPRPVEHLRMDVDPVPQRGERQETVLVRPNQR